MARRRLIPSMFHRRLVLLLVLTMLPLGVIAAQMVRLTVLEGDELAAEAQSKLVIRSWTPTVRGRILDRNGRVLARDRASFSVSVDYEVITGSWARTQAARAARAANAESWAELSKQQRLDLVERSAPAFELHLDRMWDRFATLAGTDRQNVDERRRSVIDRVQSMASHQRSRRVMRLTEQQLALGREITEEVGQRLVEQADMPIGEERAPHVLAARVSDEVGFAFMRAAQEIVDLTPVPGGESLRVPLMPGLSVVDSGRREYPFDTVSIDIDRSTFPGDMFREGFESVTVRGVAAHVLGRVRGKLYAEDVRARAELLENDSVFRRRVTPDLGSSSNDGWRIDLGQYMTGDAVGHTGIEASAEPDLRGLRGLVYRELDTGAETVIERTHGRDVRLTLDIMLQARIQAVMESDLAVVQDWHGNQTLEVGTNLAGAAVVLAIESGDVLAMVTTPTYTRQDLDENAEEPLDDPATSPFVDRTVSKPYPPGSIAKAIIFCEASKRGAYLPGQTIECTGHLLPDRPDLYRCWIYKNYSTTHTAQLGRALNPVDALTVSCNIFFFTLGQRLGVDGVTAAYRDFGLGTPFGLGVGPEFIGGIGPVDTEHPSGDPTALHISDAILMGIGQGPVAWTPMHAAAAYATVARGGVYVSPRVRADTLQEVRDIRVDSAVTREVLRGLYGSVNDDIGTGNHITLGGRRRRIFNAETVDVWGKTGTAQAPDIIADPDGDGPQPAQTLRTGDHSWFVILCGPAGAEPEYAIAVVMEYAGSGGRVSGPIANQIVQALIAEGYL